MYIVRAAAVRAKSKKKKDAIKDTALNLFAHLLTCLHFSSSAQWYVYRFISNSTHFHFVGFLLCVFCFLDFILFSPAFLLPHLFHLDIWNVFVNTDQTLRVFTDVKLLNSSSWVNSLTKLTSLLFIVTFLLSFLGHFPMRLQVCNCVSEDHVFPHFCASTFEKCLFWLLAELNRSLIWLTLADHTWHSALSKQIAFSSSVIVPYVVGAVLYLYFLCAFSLLSLWSSMIGEPQPQVALYGCLFVFCFFLLCMEASSPLKILTEICESTG